MAALEPDGESPPRRAVTLTDVAVRAGVSQPTASRVLNGSLRKPAQHIVDAVRKAADELGYSPNAQAQALARASTGLLGLVVHDVADPYFSAIVSGVQLAAAARQRQVMLSVTMRSPDVEVRCIESFVAHRTEAIIMVGSRMTTPAAVEAQGRLTSTLARYTANGGRFTVIGQAVPGADAVIPDNRGGGAALANALVGEGIRDFVLLSGPAQLTSAADRAAGFIGALRKHELKPRAVLNGEFTRDGGYESARRAIAEFRPSADAPVCFVAGNDVMAAGAMTATRDARLRIPLDVQIAGFDDIPTLRDLSPGLTTVRLPLQSMGEIAVELALGGGEARTKSIAGEVVLRESTAWASRRRGRRVLAGTP
jgi:LacI family transcriptional regulator